MLKKLFLLLFCLFNLSKCQKNILFLVADDLRPNLGSYDGANDGIFHQPPMYTPNIDALASKSLVFEKAYDSMALCSPSRTATLTGRRPDTTRITRIGYYWRDYGGNFTTIPQFFREKGYWAVGAGKVFHGGPSSGNDHLMNCDCDYSWDVCPYHDPPDGYPESGDVSWKALDKATLDEAPLQDQKNTKWLLPKIRDAAKKFKEEDTPFFVAYGVHKPHTPWYFPEEFLEYYPEESIDLPDNPNAPINLPDIAWSSPPIFRQFIDVYPNTTGIPDLGQINVTLPNDKIKELRRAYYAATSYADHQLGIVIDELYKQGVAEDTIIVFWGDHGWQLGEHAEWCKHNNFEVTNRVPFMIRIPGVTDHGMKTSKLVELVDLFPTLVEAAGFDPLKSCPHPSNDEKLCTEGRSMIPLFEDPTNDIWEDTVFWQYPMGGYINDVVPWTQGYSIRTAEFRYTEHVWIKKLGDVEYEPDWDRTFEREHIELYDLRNDPQENINVCDDPLYKDMKEQLAYKLRLGWQARSKSL